MTRHPNYDALKPSLLNRARTAVQIAALAGVPLYTVRHWLAHMKPKPVMARTWPRVYWIKAEVEARELEEARIKTRIMI